MQEDRKQCFFTHKCTSEIADAYVTGLSYVKVEPLIPLENVSMSVSSSTLAWHFEEITTTTANTMLLKKS